ncbi:MAG: EamA family transporter [Candidatus Aminicenantia bacterium]
MQGIILFSISSLIFVASQIFIKFGINRIENKSGFSFLLSAITSPFVLSGLLLSGIGLIVWFFILSRYELSYSVLVLSITYVLFLLCSHIFLGETISILRWIGAILIIIGVYIVTRT